VVLLALIKAGQLIGLEHYSIPRRFWASGLFLITAALAFAFLQGNKFPAMWHPDERGISTSQVMSVLALAGALISNLWSIFGSWQSMAYDTRAEMARWIEAHLQKDAVIAQEGWSAINGGEDSYPDGAVSRYALSTSGSCPTDPSKARDERG
jgi:hypothetical protein